MEEKNKLQKSIYGKWWQAVRIWFYPIWLLYELSIRFYDYAIAVQNYFVELQDHSFLRFGEIGTNTLAMLCSVSTFIVCTAFLTVPASFVLYKFFKIENLTTSPFEAKLKKYF